MRPATRPNQLGRRFGWLLVLVAALLARSIAPQGWMPVVNAAGGIELTVCNGMGRDDRMVLSADGKLHHEAPAKDQSNDHPCAFAGLGVADTPPSLAMASIPAFVPDATPLPDRVSIAPGRGLAAPPPPATGPPSLA
jgi:hypothetical protein